MQNLITNLTRNVTILDEELQMERLLNHQLKLSLDEATRQLESQKTDFKQEIEELTTRIDALEAEAKQPTKEPMSN